MVNKNIKKIKNPLYQTIDFLYQDIDTHNVDHTSQAFTAIDSKYDVSIANKVFTIQSNYRIEVKTNGNVYINDKLVDRVDLCLEKYQKE